MSTRFQDPLVGSSAPWIYVCTCYVLVACTGFVCLRFWVRRGRYGFDDLFSGLSYLSVLVSCAVVYSALKQGLGTPEHSSESGTCSKVASRVVSSLCLLIVTDGLSKCATTALTRRIISTRATPTQAQRWICDATLATSAVYIALGVALLASDCANICYPPQPSASNCIPNVGRIAVIAVISTVTELALFGLPVWLFGQLKMARSTKMTTLGLYAVRLPLIAFSIVLVTYYKHYLTKVDNSASDIGPGIYWHLAFLACTNIVPCIQSLKSIAETMFTSGAAVGGTLDASRSRSYPLQDLSSGPSKKDLKRPSTYKELKPDVYAIVSHSVPVDIDRESVGSDRSDRMIIRQERR